MSGHPVLRFAGWTYDAATRSLRSPDGEPVTLTPREDSLLRVFLDHPQEELAREFLADALYGAHPPVDGYSAVNVNVARLRGKLRRAKSSPPIILMVSRGYYFTPAPETD